MEYLQPLLLIKALGLVGILAVVFAESGLFFGFFLPGDSLLFTAGFLASQGFLPIFPLLIGTACAAVLGDAFGYWFGRFVGEKLFVKDDSFFFKKSHVVRAQKFYERHGKRAIVIARFVPVVRTFAPIVAGVGRMPYPIFFSYNVIGGISWSFGLTLAGFFLGHVIPSIDTYLLPIVVGIIVLSLLPWASEWYHERRTTNRTF